MIFVLFILIRKTIFVHSDVIINTQSTDYQQVISHVFQEIFLIFFFNKNMAIPERTAKIEEMRNKNKGFFALAAFSPISALLLSRPLFTREAIPDVSVFGSWSFSALFFGFWTWILFVEPGVKFSLQSQESGVLL